LKVETVFSRQSNRIVTCSRYESFSPQSRVKIFDDPWNYVKMQVQPCPWKKDSRPFEFGKL